MKKQTHDLLANASRQNHSHDQPVFQVRFAQIPCAKKPNSVREDLLSKDIPSSQSAAESSLPGIVGAVAAVFGRVFPLPLDGPSTKALVIGVIASEVAMLDEPADSVAAAVVDVLVLTHDVCREFKSALQWIV